MHKDSDNSYRFVFSDITGISEGFDPSLIFQNFAIKYLKISVVISECIGHFQTPKQNSLYRKIDKTKAKQNSLYRFILHNTDTRH